MTQPPLPSDAAALFGNRFLTHEVPTKDFPANGMSASRRDATGR